MKRLFFNPLTKPSEKHDPELPGVTFTVTSEQGDKLGIYYEHKDEDGNPLRQDILRTIGRFWKPVNQEEDRYIVRIKATAGERSGEIKLEVKKPAKLHDPSVYSFPFKTTTNIRGESLDIDELCIKYAGEIGISPQVIKGQIFQEADKTNNQFNPSYRYEPWRDYGFASEKQNPKYWRDYRKQPFWVTGQQPKPMGEGEEIPSNHQNVRPLQYPTSAVPIADYALAHWDQYFLPARDSIIGSGPLSVTFQNYLDELRDTYLMPLFGISEHAIATFLIQKKIGDTYTDYAQTRKAASYGLIQMLYTTALVQGYNKGKSINTSEAPEKLNDEVVEMPFYKSFTEKNLRVEFGGENAVVPESSWAKGWEGTWMDSFLRYNGRSGYPRDVFEHSKKFYPQKNQGAL